MGKAATWAFVLWSKVGFYGIEDGLHTRRSPKMHSLPGVLLSQPLLPSKAPSPWVKFPRDVQREEGEEEEGGGGGGGKEGCQDHRLCLRVKLDNFS